MQITPTLRKMVGTIWQYGRPVVGTLPLGIMIALTEMAMPQIIKYLLDEGFNDRERAIWIVPLAILSILLVRGLCVFGSSYLVGLSENNVLIALRRKLFAKMMRVPPNTFTQGSKEINLIIDQSMRFAEFITIFFNGILRSVLKLVALVGYIFWLNWVLALLIIACFPLIAIILKYVNNRLKKLNTQQIATGNTIISRLQESYRGQHEVRIYGAQKYETNAIDQLYKKFRSTAMRIAIANGWAAPLVQLVIGIAIIVAIIVALLQTESTSAGSFVGFLTAVIMLTTPFKQLTSGLNRWQQANTGAEAIFTFLATKEENTQGLPLAHSKAHIRFEEVCFSYEKDQSLLKNISFSLKKGQSLALVGASGSGKTTIINLLTRFYQPLSGTIYLDDHDIQSYALPDYRNQIATVNQNVVLFDDTLRANITYGSDCVDEERLNTAVKHAYLESVVSDLEHGLDTRLGTNGMLLSGGQRQRVAIARAFYKNAPILILDEATSALDSLSESSIQKGVSDLMQERATIIIAHRLSTIENADCILVLSNGCIVESGTHNELIAAQKNYAQLYHNQFLTTS